MWYIWVGLLFVFFNFIFVTFETDLKGKSYRWDEMSVVYTFWLFLWPICLVLLVYFCLNLPKMEE